MPANSIFRRLLISAAVAAVFAVAAAAVLDKSELKSTSENASAYVIFTETDADTGAEALRAELSSVDMLEKISIEADVPIIELSYALSVRSFGESSAEITLSGLREPENSPVILGALINLAEKSEEIPRFKVGSYCDMKHTPKLPFIEICLGAGLVTGLLIFIISGLILRPKRKKRKEQASEKKEKKVAPPKTQKKEKLNEGADIPAFESIGNVGFFAPEGIRKNGAYDAAMKLMGFAAAGRARIFAVSAASRGEGKTAVFSEKCTAYLSCALAECGQKVAVIECSLKKPMVGKIFGKTGAGGVSGIAAGSCTIWNALVPDARRNVDIIAEKSPYDGDPAEVFGSGAFGQLLEYISGQYDIILLCAPKAWDCAEWDLVEKNCDGVIAVRLDDIPPDRCCIEGMAAEKDRLMLWCNVRTDDRI